MPLTGSGVVQWPRLLLAALSPNSKSTIMSSVFHSRFVYIRTGGGERGGYYDSGLSVAGNKVSSVSQQLC